MKEQPVFLHFNDKVKIIKGFHEGREGILYDYSMQTNGKAIYDIKFENGQILKKTSEMFKILESQSVQ